MPQTMATACLRCDLPAAYTPFSSCLNLACAFWLLQENDMYGLNLLVFDQKEMLITGQCCTECTAYFTACRTAHS